MEKIIGTCFLLIGILFIGASCNFTSAKISGITLTNKLDETTQEAIGSNTTFSADAGTIYASVNIKNAPPNTIVKGSWYLNEKLLGDKEVEMEGTRAIGFRITNALFDAGDYKFKAEIRNSDTTEEIIFKVEQSASQKIQPLPVPETTTVPQTPTDQSELPATESQY